MGDAADDAERRAEQEMEEEGVIIDPPEYTQFDSDTTTSEFVEEGVRIKLPTKAKEVEYEEVVAYGLVMGNIWEDGLSIYSFGTEAEGEEWAKRNTLRIEAIVPIRQVKKRIIQVPYNPDIEGQVNAT